MIRSLCSALPCHVDGEGLFYRYRGSTSGMHRGSSIRGRGKAGDPVRIDGLTMTLYLWRGTFVVPMDTALAGQKKDDEMRQRVTACCQCRDFWPFLYTSFPEIVLYTHL